MGFFSSAFLQHYQHIITTYLHQFFLSTALKKTNTKMRKKYLFYHLKPNYFHHAIITSQNNIKICRQGLEPVYTRSSNKRKILQGLVISKLDYCNGGLLLGTSAHQLNMLQIVQNMLCRIIKNLRKYDHITAYLLNMPI